jgi:2-dehydro-3-deoxyphosphogluconate aldolase / (4S)-4-hydroxy-2-oxoglutarate aldolase
MGGASYIRAVKAPFPQIELMPMGGVALDNAEAYINAGATTLGIGSGLVSVAVLREGRSKEITAAACAYCERIHQARHL